MDVPAVEGGESKDSPEPPEKEDDREEVGLDTAESEDVAGEVGVMQRVAGRCGRMRGLVTGEEDGEGGVGGKGGRHDGVMVRKWVTSASFSRDAASNGSCGKSLHPSVSFAFI